MPHECIFEWIVSQIHFGVSGGLPRFALENQAVNDATFACPDELGWKPQVALLPNCLFSLSTHQTNIVILYVLFASLFLCRGSLLYHLMETSHRLER
jgi:hypothetical protein